VIRMGMVRNCSRRVRVKVWWTIEATSPSCNKRQSMLGNLGRRASIQLKNENATLVAADSKTPIAEESTAPAVTEKICSSSV
jgi:hypothetical protein